MSSNRLLSVDALRALAASYVVLYHLYGWPRMESAPTEPWYYLFYRLHWGYMFFRSTLLGLYSGPLFSLALEEQLYLLYQPFLWLRPQLGLRAAVGGIGLLTVCFRLIPQFIHGVGDLWTNWPWSGPSRWFEWCLGCLAVEAYRERIELPGWCYNPALAVLLFALGLNAGYFSDPLTGLASFLLLNWAVSREEGVPRTRLLKGLAATGVWSYSLYLLHRPTLQWTSFVLVALHLENLPSLARVVVMLGAVCATAYLFFIVIERRFLNKPKIEVAVSAGD